MRPTFALCLLALAGCYPQSWRADAPLQLTKTYPFDVGPYVIYQGPGRITVVVEHAMKTAPVVTWRPATSTAAADVRSVTAVPDDGMWLAELDELPLDEALEYTVQSEVGNAGPISFRGGRSRGRRFRFAAFGDTRTGHKVHRSLVESITAENVDLVIHSGDIVESGGVAEQWVEFFDIESPLASGSPLIAAIGNHDMSQRRYFRRYFLHERYAEGRRYFHRDWGDIRVIVMDTEIEAREGSEQYRYLEEAMRTGAAEGRLMLVTLHYPPYSAGAHGSNLEMREILSKLCPKYGVEVVLAGHDHNYERTKRIDGVTYFVAASGGAPIRRLSPSWFSEVVRTEPHFILFDVERGSLVGRAVNLAGETFDAFVIPPLEPGAGRKP